MTFSGDGCRITDTEGRKVKLSKQRSESDLSVGQLKLLSHAKKCMKHCHMLENVVGSLEHTLEKGSFFPLVVGRKPTTTGMPHIGSED